MSKHTPGPWAVGPDIIGPIDAAGRFTRHIVAKITPARLKRQRVSADQVAADYRLIAAAPDLLGAQTMGVELNTPDFLDWISDRLIHVYGESPNVDFVQSLKVRAAAGRAAIAKATGETP